MASSVSSERAFSAAGITISKRRGSLKCDIVEALQCLKSLINSDLIFRERDVTVDWEFENEVVDWEFENEVVDGDDDPEWVDMDAESDDEAVN